MNGLHWVRIVLGMNSRGTNSLWYERSKIRRERSTVWIVYIGYEQPMVQIVYKSPVCPVGSLLWTITATFWPRMKYSGMNNTVLWSDLPMAGVTVGDWYHAAIPCKDVIKNCRLTCSLFHNSFQWIVVPEPKSRMVEPIVLFCFQWSEASLKQVWNLWLSRKTLMLLLVHL